MRLAEVVAASRAVAGTAASRAQLLRELFGRATRDEQDFLMQLLVGELRQGALEGILMDAVARASGPGGFALRFASVKRYRTDKTAAETDTFATVESMYRDQTPANRTPGV